MRKAYKHKLQNQSNTIKLGNLIDDMHQIRENRSRCEAQVSPTFRLWVPMTQVCVDAEFAEFMESANLRA